MDSGKGYSPLSDRLSRSCADLAPVTLVKSTHVHGCTDLLSQISSSNLLNLSLNSQTNMSITLNGSRYVPIHYCDFKNSLEGLKIAPRIH